MTDQIMHEVPCKSCDGRGRPKKFHVDKAWFERRYLKDMAPTHQIAKGIGCVNEHVTAIAKKLGVPLRGRLKRSIPHPRMELDLERIIKLYVEDEMASDKIAEILGCSTSPVLQRLKEAGVKIRHHNDTKRGKLARNRIDIDPKEIAELYAKMYESGQTIADKFGVSRQVIDRIMKENGIAKKPMSETRNYVGENSPRWRADLTQEERESRRDVAKQAIWRGKIFERDGYCCMKCYDKTGGNLNAHHIVPHSKDKSIAWELWNGITLCAPCHVTFHTTYGYTECTKDDLDSFLRHRQAA